MLTLALLAALGQMPQHRLFLQPNLPRGDYAFFEFAPSSGAGMTAACACTVPTGAKGEALTFTRTGAATCSKKGLATTGIADGDLVVCANDNEPRVEPSGGVLGLRVESARTNSILRSQELDNAAWVLTNTGVGTLPTRTANAATAPDGTATAERFQFSACGTAGDSSLVYQLHAASGASASTIYCKGNGSTQTISICSFGSTGSSGCSPVSCPSDSWSRVQDLRTTTGTGGLVVGCNHVTSSYAGASSTGAADVFLWGAQQEMGAAYATSYIPTVAASATRNADRGYLALASTPKGADGIYSMSATVATLSDVSRNWEVAVLNAGGVAPYASLYSAGVNDRCESFNGTSLAATTAATGPSGRWTCWNDGATEQGIRNGTAFTSPVAGTRSGVGFNRIYVATASAGYEIEGIITNVCADPNPSRCR